MQKTQVWRELLACQLLVLVGVAGRWLIDIPNFKPVAAIALVSGLWLSRAWLALAVPVAILAISDMALAAYPGAVRLAVYGGLCGGCLVGMWIRRYGRIYGWQLIAASLAGSCVFFIVSNGVWWGSTAIYPRTLAGLVECYAAAIPFFRCTVLGDLFFVAVLVLGRECIAGHRGRSAAVETRPIVRLVCSQSWR